MVNRLLKWGLPLVAAAVIGATGQHYLINRPTIQNLSHKVAVAESERDTAKQEKESLETSLKTVSDELSGLKWEVEGRYVPQIITSVGDPEFSYPNDFMKQMDTTDPRGVVTDQEISDFANAKKWDKLVKGGDGTYRLEGTDLEFKPGSYNSFEFDTSDFPTVSDLESDINRDGRRTAEEAKTHNALVQAGVYAKRPRITRVDETNLEGSHTYKISWSGTGEELKAERYVRFDPVSGSQRVILLGPLTQNPEDIAESLKAGIIPSVSPAKVSKPVAKAPEWQYVPITKDQFTQVPGKGLSVNVKKGNVLSDILLEADRFYGLTDPVLCPSQATDLSAKVLRHGKALGTSGRDLIYAGEELFLGPDILSEIDPCYQTWFGRPEAGVTSKEAKAPAKEQEALPKVEEDKSRLKYELRGNHLTFTVPSSGFVEGLIDLDGKVITYKSPITSDYDPIMSEATARDIRAYLEKEQVKLNPKFTEFAPGDTVTVDLGKERFIQDELLKHYVLDQKGKRHFYDVPLSEHVFVQEFDKRGNPTRLLLPENGNEVPINLMLTDAYLGASPILSYDEAAALYNTARRVHSSIGGLPAPLAQPRIDNYWRWFPREGSMNIDLSDPALGRDFIEALYGTN